MASRQIVDVETPLPDDNPVPAPLPDVHPNFANLGNPPIVGGSIQWDAILALAVLSEIAYEDGETQIRRANELGAFQVEPLAIDSSEGFVASDATTVVIAFRGTQGYRDLVTDILGFPRAMKGGVVHAGFSRAIGSIYDAALKAAENQGAAQKTVWVTGHSLGGAIACGFSMYASKEDDLQIDGIVTFGQPLVMDKPLCQFMIDTYHDRYLRVVNGIDPITTLINRYRHAGARAQLHDHGEYDWQPPQIAVMAPPPGLATPVEAPDEVLEPKPELQLISEEEAIELDRRIKAAFDGGPSDSPDVPQAFGSFLPSPIDDHLMPGYISRIKEISRRKATKPTVSD